MCKKDVNRWYNIIKWWNGTVLSALAQNRRDQISEIGFADRVLTNKICAEDLVNFSLMET